MTTCPEKGELAVFREARKLKQGYDDGLFREGSGTLADVSEARDEDVDEEEEDDDDLWDDEEDDWDPDHQHD